MVTSTPADITGSLLDLRDPRGASTCSCRRTTPRGQLHHVERQQRAPFDDIRMRLVPAHGHRPGRGSTISPTPASRRWPTSRSPPGDPGYVDDPGYPQFDAEQAKTLVEEYKGGGQGPLVLADGHDRAGLWLVRAEITPDPVAARSGSR